MDFDPVAINLAHIRHATGPAFSTDADLNEPIGRHDVGQNVCLFDWDVRSRPCLHAAGEYSKQHQHFHPARGLRVVVAVGSSRTDQPGPRELAAIIANRQSPINDVSRILRHGYITTCCNNNIYYFFNSYYY